MEIKEIVMAVGQSVMGQSTQTYEREKQRDSARMRTGLQKIREALISDAKVASSRPSKLPKDWRNRVFK